MVADGNRRGYRLLLDSFWDDARKQGVRLPQSHPVSAEAFCMARRKLRPDLLGDLIRTVAGKTQAMLGSRGLWKGRRIIAIDGSKVSLARDPRLHCAFGSARNAHTPQALLSVAFDAIA